MSTKKILYQSDELTVVAQDFSSSTIFITFNEWGHLPKGDTFWGDTFFEKLRIASIGIVARQNWYPSTEMDTALASVLAIIKKRRVITYGHSQGGYGALKYSRRLGAEASIAFCPQYSIHPKHVGSWDKRFIGFYKDSLQGGLPIESDDLGGACYIFFDPSENMDRKNVQKIQQLRSSTSKSITDPPNRNEALFISVPLSGHSTVRLLAEGKVAREFIESFTGEIPPTAIFLRSLLRKARINSRTYFAGRMAYLRRRQVRHTLFIKKEINDVRYPITEHARACIRLQTALNEKNIAEAKNILSHLQIDNLRIEDVSPISLWQGFRQNKFSEGELWLAHSIVKFFKSSTLILLHAVRSFLEHENHQLASELLSEILTRKDALAHVGHMVDFSGRLKDPEIYLRILIRIKSEGIAFPQNNLDQHAISAADKVIQEFDEKLALDSLKSLALVHSDAKKFLLNVKPTLLERKLFSTFLDLQSPLSEDKDALHIRITAVTELSKIDRLEGGRYLQECMRSVNNLEPLEKDELLNQIATAFEEMGSLKDSLDIMRKISWATPSLAKKSQLAKLYLASGSRVKCVAHLLAGLRIRSASSFELIDAARLARQASAHKLVKQYINRYEEILPKISSIEHLYAASFFMSFVDGEYNDVAYETYCKAVELNAWLTEVQWLHFLDLGSKRRVVCDLERYMDIATLQHPQSDAISSAKKIAKLVSRFFVSNK